jgi:large subunit ribosomal protein L18e
MMSKQFKPVVSLSGLQRLGAKRNSDAIIAVVATVTNDERLLNAPKLNVCALRFTKTARSRIENVFFLSLQSSYSNLINCN